MIGTAFAWPPVLFAQSPKRNVVIGVLVPENPEPFLRAFKEGLRERGYVEGRNLRIEFRTAAGKTDRLNELAAELVRLKVDVLVAWQTPAAHALQRATRELPIAISAGDPVGTGLIRSLSHPGGNITGVTGTTAELGGKTLELIRELLPGAKRVAVLANALDPFTRFFVKMLDDGARALSMEIQTYTVRGADEFDAAFADAVKWRAEAVVIQPSLPRQAAIAQTLKHRLPAVSPIRGFPDAGGLMAYGPNHTVLTRELAGHVDKLVNGAKPADLPVQQASIFELVINLRTAKALGLAVPRSLLLRADKVIE
jgi:putative ABC transport system substrate-binding protein